MDQLVTARAATVLAFFGACFPAPALGQAICSAPHSSPTLTQSGAIRTLPAGAGWVQLSLSGQRATEAFNPLGERQPLIGGSSFDTRSVFLTAAYGLTEGLEVWGQLPGHRLTVSGSTGRSEGSGLGDIRAAVRVSPAVVGWTVPVALRLGVKLPGSDFPVDPRAIPLTEGQRDVESSVEAGWSGTERPLYAVGWVGYRWRAANEVAGFEPGDERFFHAAVGGWVGRVTFELGLDVLWGAAPVEQGLTLEGDRRRLVQILPTVGVGVGPGRLEVTAPVSVAGRNLPSGVGIGIGYRTAWGL